MESRRIWILCRLMLLSWRWGIRQKRRSIMVWDFQIVLYPVLIFGHFSSRLFLYQFPVLYFKLVTSVPDRLFLSQCLLKAIPGRPNTASSIPGLQAIDTKVTDISWMPSDDSKSSTSGGRVEGTSGTMLGKHPYLPSSKILFQEFQVVGPDLQVTAEAPAGTPPHRMPQVLRLQRDQTGPPYPPGTCTAPATEQEAPTTTAT